MFRKTGRAETSLDPAPLTMFEVVVHLKPKDDWRPGVTQESIVAELERRTRTPGLQGAGCFIWSTSTRRIAVWVRMIALLGVAAETASVMVVYLDAAWNEGLRSGAIADVPSLLEAAAE